ncbi:SLBB domain-containing protein [Flavobacteriaceae bacterium]|nr:SLBB domain-containing protein [Flavobacteriaceae bacterium]
MKNMKHYFFYIFIFIGIGNFSYSQNIDISDFSSINFLELNSSELDLLLRRASSQGYNQFDLIKMAKAQGLSEKDIEKLNSKFENSEAIKRVSSNASSPIENTRLREDYNQSISIVREKESDVYGYNIFKGNGFLTFQANSNISTPSDYILGTGDNIYVDIYGESESYFNGQISPEGEVIFENIGPINLNGLDIKMAKRRLKSKFSKVYSGLVNNRTFINVSIGVPRTIKVNIVGEVNLPGTYSFSALNTVYNAIYVAGGINENATLRDIKVFRKNKLINTVDIYNYLNSGDGSSNVRLENDDLILVGPYSNRIRIEGEIKNPGRFEFTKNESLKDLLNYAGGFSEKAFKKSIKLTRVIDNQLMVMDVNEDQYKSFEPKSGDLFKVDRILETYRNRVILKGAVQRPGIFSLDDKMTVSQLIKKANGLKPDALIANAYIKRTNSDFSTINISFNLDKLIKGEIEDIILNKEDVLTIVSKNDLINDQFIKISGEVSKPGIFPYSNDISLSDIIILSGGFNDKSFANRIEITRRISKNSLTEQNISEIITLDLSSDLDSLETIILEPYDEVIIRKNPNFYAQRYVSIEGQVNYPGKYAISSFNERISNLLERSGGIKSFAYKKGATLIRKTEFFKKDSEEIKQINSLNNLKDKLNKDPELLTESESLLLKRIENSLKILGDQSNNEKDFLSYAKRERINDIVKRNSLNEDQISIGQSEAIGINLDEIIQNPESKSNLLLQEGDLLIIPKKQETVRLRGMLLYPTTVRFKNNKSFKYFINSAGGFDVNAKRSGAYVVYANGDVSRTKKFLFLNIYPKIEPGAEIIVPAQPIKSPIGVSQILNYTTGLATLILAITQIN